MDKYPKNPIFVSFRRYSCLVLVSFYILTANSVHINAQKPSLTIAESEQLTETTTHFAIDLLRAVSEDTPSKSVVLSSFSIQTCLGVLQLGAENEPISTDLQRLLPAHSVFGKVLDIYTKNNILTTASHFLFSPDSYVLPSFNYPVAQYFRITSDEINMEYGPPVDSRMFRWFRREGMPRTRTIFYVKSGEKRRLMFGNSMNFANKWHKKFSKAHTHLEDFHITTARRAKVPMMTQVGPFLHAYLPNLKATALTLHYSDFDMSMLMLLPDLDSDIDQLQKALTYDAIKEIRYFQWYLQVKVKLPKLNVTSSVLFTEPLTKLGLEDIFSTNMRIFDTPDILRVQKIEQKNYFTLTEEGTNLEDCATQLGYKIPFTPEAQYHREFFANRPFIFFIQNEAGHTFYAGKINHFE